MKMLVLPTLTFLTIVTCIQGQAVTVVPAWSDPQDPTYDDHRSAYLPPEYAGGHPAFAKFCFRRFADVLRLDGISLTYSPYSGVILITDHGATPRFYGWDTTLDRVYSCNKIAVDSSGSSRVILAGWRQGAARLEDLTLASGSPPLQAPMKSSSNSLWVSAGIVGTSLYAFDLQQHSIVRWNDIDGDGAFESFDSSFSVVVPPVFDSTDPSTSVAPHANPVFGFQSTPHGVLRIETNSGRRVLGLKKTVVVKEASPGVWQLSAIENGEPPSLRFGSHVIAGQRRFRVLGPAGEKLKIIERLQSGSEVEISDKLTIPASGELIAESGAPISTGSVVYAAPASQQTNTKASLEHPADANYTAVLFPDSEFWHHAKVQEIVHDSLPSDARLWCKLEDSCIELTVLQRRKHKVVVVLPDLGNPVIAAPFDKLAPAWIVATAADGTTAISPPFYHSIWYN